MKGFPYYKQFDSMDCGPACLRMIAKFYDLPLSRSYAERITFFGREGVSLSALSDAAEVLGFKTLSVKIGLEELIDLVPLPCILHWKSSHFVVIPPHRLGGDRSKLNITVVDPQFGPIKLNKDDFMRLWIPPNETNGICLILEPPDEFKTTSDINKQTSKFAFFLKHLTPYRGSIFYILFFVLMSAGFALLLPFLIQSLVDKGIGFGDLHFIKVIIGAQVCIVICSSTIDLVRNKIIIKMTNRINISMVSEFLTRLMNLPISFFDSKMAGDVHNRIADNYKLQKYITSSAFTTAVSVSTLIVLCGFVYIHSVQILCVFLVGTVLSSLWTQLYTRHRKEQGYKAFSHESRTENSLLEMISAIQEIKVNNWERLKRWEWEGMQRRLLKLKLKSLSQEQYQQIGAVMFTRLQNIIIGWIAALDVVNGTLSIGTLIAVIFVTGIMTISVEQILSFIRSTHEAKISAERVGEIYELKGEDEGPLEHNRCQLLANLPPCNISFKDVWFRYGGFNGPYVLQGINLVIPRGKTTAIVGTSGSGKTTLLKLLLRLYQPSSGTIQMGEINLNEIPASVLRNHCGVVMQDGFIFSSTISRNITQEEEISEERLLEATRIANIESFINGLPRKFDTMIGNAGSGISMGQRLRILIARAVYRNPEYLFFDEATSALDAENEFIIMQNLRKFIHGRTAVIIAHRLSTVRDADQILVLDGGRLVECGNHSDLVSKKGKYFDLIKNQLELGY
ncbi:peptidase domain-containing ABC transporter [Chryseolinea lacunae]|uniref:Peptidase domain-containing ABC transporter n=1 Tax=Chryseolinea lacunae TaxID=2801331 RepID=A0ABS1KP77_9BACT|nr:peptidase domain-containing ABC transporter [Chryseolinea lacunae]MBL0741062.1 peptidase domain-containing ABC transporter [Chryseolinea lacunae]